MGYVETSSMTNTRRTFLFLQGPISPFFKLIADELEKLGHRLLRINLCFGDWLLWRRPGAINYRGSLERWPEFISNYMLAEGVTDLLLLGEQRDYHKIAIEAAKNQGIDVTVTDFGYIRPDWITFERNGMTGDSEFPRDPDVIHQIAGTVPEPDLLPIYESKFRNLAVLDMLYHLSSSLMRPLYPLYKWHHVHHPIFVYMGIGLHMVLNRIHHKNAMMSIRTLIDSDVNYFVYPLQMQNDFSIRAYSPYNDQKTAIMEVFDSFSRNAPADSKLIIRVHPLDPMLHNWKGFCRHYAKLKKIIDRIEYIDGGPLGILLENSQGVVTINSTVGIWALRDNIPIITLGQAIYDIKGLTFQGRLNEFWKEAQPPDPALRDDFLRAIAGTIQMRGVYYNQPGLSAAVAEAVERLDKRLINLPLVTVQQEQ